MRKWMRDRLKRPKKNTEAGKSEPAQAPLQPAYYNAPEAAAPASPRILDEPEAAEPEIEASPTPALQSDEEPDRNDAGQPISPARAPRSNGSADPRRRRRRGRGGRGR